MPPTVSRLSSGVVDAGDELRLRRRVGAAHRRVLDDVPVRDLDERDLDLTDRDDVAVDVDAELLEEAAGDRGGGDTRRRLAGAGALEHGAHVIEAVLHGAGEVGVAGAHRRHALDLVFDRVDRHALLPVGVVPVAVLDAHADRAAHRQAVAHAADDFGEVGLDLLALAAAVARLAPPQVLRDVVLGDRHAGRHALDDDEQAFAVRFTGGEKTEVHLSYSRPRSSAQVRGSIGWTAPSSSATKWPSFSATKSAA